MHVNFSVSSAVGCIALLGQVVLSGVIECTQYLRALAADARTAGRHSSGAPGTRFGR